MMRRLLGFSGFLSVLSFAGASFAEAAPSHAQCELSSEVRAGASERSHLVETWAALPAGVAFIAARPQDNTINLLLPAGDEYREVGLYWPTPNDPTYAYRRMSRLPRDTTLLGNDFDQTLIVLREPTEFVVNGETRVYRPIQYGGFTLSIDGCGGDDQLYGGDGNDHLFDYAGNNELRGYGGRDWLEGVGSYFGGGAGDDCITGDGGSGFAQLFGDEGDDALLSVGASGTAQGGDGNDSCVANTRGACESDEPPICLGWN